MTKRLPLFGGYGVELEYMIVDGKTLSVKPVAGHVLRDGEGAIQSEVERGDISWSNELVLHVVELKTNGPAPGLAGLAAKFQESVREINGSLAEIGCRLMPGAMHPWMNPAVEMKLWPHEYSPVYEAYHRIFDCVGHGWSNLQSTHINLPFRDDAEFGRLHAAIRVVLPILPALAASSPVCESKTMPNLDHRLEVYRFNSRRIPSISGHVVPEPVFTEADYDTHIFQRMYRDIAPHDPEGVLQDEFLNSRGAIARFGRGTIEIRVIDIQECPAADLAVVELTCELVRALTDGSLSSLADQMSWSEVELEKILLATIRDGGDAILDDPRYLELFGLSGVARTTALDLWRHVAERVLPNGSADPEVGAARRVQLEEGCLARRLVRSLGGETSREALGRTWSRMCDCLENGEMFRG